MSIYTESQLRTNRRSAKSLTMTLNESLKSFKNETPYSTTTKIFLSHKHDEREQLEGAISTLKDFGVQVYVDWLDEGMPKSTSAVTAKRIKEKIKENHKFIFLATEGAIASKWCNWELGLGDAAKYLEHIALFPVRKELTDFSGSEYLQIYPYIYEIDSYQLFKGEYRSKGTYVVYPPVNSTERVVSIKDWLGKK